MAKKTQTSIKTTEEPIDLAAVKQLQDEVAYLKEKDRILVEKFDHKAARLDWAFRHPVKFMLSRVYHQHIKQDQKNVKI